MLVREVFGSYDRVELHYEDDDNDSQNGGDDDRVDDFGDGDDNDDDLVLSQFVCVGAGGQESPLES